MPLAPNQQLFEYQIVRALGQGGFGTVYLAQDTLLNRPVAIKELTITAQTDEAAFKCCLQEARAAGGLYRPHIVAIYGLKIVGADAYLVMEYLAGGSLRALLKKHGPLPVGAAVRIVADVCEGLAAAHARGIVHRDVKPENILLTEDGRAKAGDFGVAHLPRGAGGTYLSALAATEFQPGALAYMSPEQIRGQEVDGRSDVYQVGALLHEILAGRQYVDLESLERQAREAAGSDAASFQAQLHELLAEAICEREPESVCGVQPDVPEWVGEVVVAALAKRAEKRPTAEELARALRRGETVRAAPPTPPGAAEITPAEEHYTLGESYAKQERWDEAIGEYQAALRINPDDARVHFGLGLAHARQDRWDDAIREYQAALRINPDDAKAHCNLGVAHAQHGRFDEAIRELQAALRIAPDDAEIHRNLGAVYKMQGRLDDAIREYQAALRINPDYAQAHLNLGVVHAEQGCLDDAIREYQAALRINPDYATARENLKIACAQRKRQGRASRATGSGPRSALQLGGYALVGLLLLIVLVDLGLHYVQQARQDEASSAIELFLQFSVRAAPILLSLVMLILVVARRWMGSARGKKTPKGHVRRGMAYAKRGRLDRAIGEFQAALRINPDYAEAHYGLAIAYVNQERMGDAIREAEIALRLGFEAARTLLDTRDKILREFQDAVRLNPDDAEAHYELGQVYIEMNRWDEAMQEYQATLRINPDNDDAHTNLGLVHAEQERWDEAIREHQAATRINPGNARAHNNLGSTYERQGLWDEAIQAYQAALRIDPNYARPHYGLAACYCEKGRLNEATHEAKIALRLGFEPARDLLDKLRRVSSSPGAGPQAGVWTGALSELEIAPGKLEEKVRELQAALRADPNDADAHRALGLLYEYQGCLDEAIREYQTALRINPDDAMAHNDLGVVYAEQGRSDEAIREYQAALRIDPSLDAPHYNLGHDHRQQGRLCEAIREYQAAVRTNPAYVEAHRGLGEIYAEQGRLYEAIRAFQAVLRINPDDAQAHAGLGWAYGKQGHLDEAIRGYQAAVRITSDVPDAQINLDRDVMRTNLGRLYAQQGHLDEAIRELQIAA